MAKSRVGPSEAWRGVRGQRDNEARPARMEQDTEMAQKEEVEEEEVKGRLWQICSFYSKKPK